MFHENGEHATPIADWSPSLDDASRQTELRLALTAAIDELPPRYRSVLILHDVEGLSNIEAAETLGLSVPNVKSRVHRARLFLRKRLAETHVERECDDGRPESVADMPARPRMTGAERTGERDAAEHGIDAG